MMMETEKSHDLLSAGQEAEKSQQCISTPKSEGPRTRGRQCHPYPNFFFCSGPQQIG